MKNSKLVLILILGLWSFNSWSQNCNDYNKGTICPSSNIPIEAWYEDSWNNIGIGSGGSDDFSDDILSLVLYMRPDGGPIGCSENTSLYKFYTGVLPANMNAQTVIDIFNAYQADNNLSGNENDIIHVRLEYRIYSAFGWNDNDISHKLKFSVINDGYLTPQLPNLTSYCPNDYVNFNDYNLTSDNSQISYSNIEWSVNSNPITSNYLNTSTLVSGIQELGLSVNIGTCSFDFNNFDQFTIHPTETIEWTASPPTPIYTNHTDIDLTSYLNVSNLSAAVHINTNVGSVGNDLIFHPNNFGVNTVELTPYLISNDGCTFSSTYSKSIQLIGAPAVRNYIYLDLEYASWNGLEIVRPGDPRNFIYNPNDFIWLGNTPTDINSKYNYHEDFDTRISQIGHSVCDGTVNHLKVGWEEPGYTYKWYKDDANGIVQFVGAGTTYDDYVVDIGESYTYNVYVSATNSQNLEGALNPFRIQVNHVENNLQPIIKCIDTTETVSLPTFSDYDAIRPFKIIDSANVTIDSAYRFLTTYDWYENGILINEGSNHINYNFDGVTKMKEYTLRQRMKSGPLWDGDYYNIYDPEVIKYNTTDTTGSGFFLDLFANKPRDYYYDIVKCECESNGVSTVKIVKNPVAEFVSNVNGELNILDPIRYIDNSLHGGISPTVIWEFNDGSFGHTGDTVWHFMTDFGVFDIQNIIIDQYGCSDTLVKIDYISVIDYTEINEYNETGELILFPIPTTGALNIIGKNIEEIIIYDLKGNEVFKTNYQEQINIDHLENGIYFIKATLSKGTILTKKIIKQ